MDLFSLLTMRSFSTRPTLLRLKKDYSSLLWISTIMTLQSHPKKELSWAQSTRIGSFSKYRVNLLKKENRKKARVRHPKLKQRNACD